MKVSAIILAGGRGSRMGGIDKGWVMHAGRPFVEGVIECLQPQVEELFISANRNIERYAQLGFPVLPDLQADYRGPLAGLQAAFRKANHPWVLTVPCDTPALPPDLAARLIEGVTKTTSTVAVVTTPEGWQPTFCLAHVGLAKHLDNFLKDGNRRARDWIAQQRVVQVPFDRADDFINLNSPEDLQGPHGQDH